MLDDRTLYKLISETTHKLLTEMAASTTPDQNLYITYGFAVDTKDKFRQLVRSGSRYEVFRHTNKPLGGLWGSPTDSDYGWKDFCTSEDYDTDKLGTYTLWKLKNEATVYVINSVEDFKDLLDNYGYRDNDGYSRDPRYKNYIIDYNKMSQDYDGIFLTDKGNSSCRDYIEYKDGYANLGTWDCESIVVWNPGAIEIVETHV